MAQSNFIVSAKVGAEKDHLSPLLDFKINFMDRQTIKILEDSVIDLQVIFPTLLDNINGIRSQCQKWCQEHHSVDKCDCAQMIAEFNEHVREAEGNVKRADALREKAKSTTQLVSFVLYFVP